MRKITLVAAMFLCLIAGAGGFCLLNRERDPRLDLISRKDALEDYDYLWEILEENYPFFGVAERKYGLDVQQLKQDYRQQLEGMGKEIDFLKFYQLMKDCVGEFHQLGHFIMYSPQDYQSHMAGKEYLCEFALSRWQVEHYLEESKVQKRYDFLESKEVSSNWSEQPQSERLTFNRFQDEIAYMKINSFYGQYIEQDREKILNFFRENADIPNLIIDIQNNSGGSSYYWYENLVRPNIEEKMEAPFLEVTPYGNRSREQMKLDGYEEQALNAEIEELEELPEINQDDLISGWYWEKDEGDAIAPQSNEKLYKGRIFLLVNDGTRSAADSFAYFCKGSGFATVLGQENTRGDGPGSNFVLDQLPHSNLLFRYRPILALDMKGVPLEESGVEPDVLLPTRAKNSNDKVSPLAACLIYIEELEEIE